MTGVIFIESRSERFLNKAKDIARRTAAKIADHLPEAVALSGVVALAASLSYEYDVPMAAMMVGLPMIFLGFAEIVRDALAGRSPEQQRAPTRVVRMAKIAAVVLVALSAFLNEEGIVRKGVEYVQEEQHIAQINQARREAEGAVLAAVLQVEAEKMNRMAEELKAQAQAQSIVEAAETIPTQTAVIQTAPVTRISPTEAVNTPTQGVGSEVVGNSEGPATPTPLSTPTEAVQGPSDRPAVENIKEPLQIEVTTSRPDENTNSEPLASETLKNLVLAAFLGSGILAGTFSAGKIAVRKYRQISQDMQENRPISKAGTQIKEGIVNVLKGIGRSVRKNVRSPIILQSPWRPRDPQK